MILGAAALGPAALNPFATNKSYLPMELAPLGAGLAFSQTVDYEPKDGDVRCAVAICLVFVCRMHLFSVVGARPRATPLRHLVAFLAHVPQPLATMLAGVACCGGGTARAVRLRSRRGGAGHIRGPDDGGRRGQRRGQGRAARGRPHPRPRAGAFCSLLCLLQFAFAHRYTPAHSCGNESPTVTSNSSALPEQEIHSNLSDKRPAAPPFPLRA